MTTFSIHPPDYLLSKPLKIVVADGEIGRS